MAPTNFTFNPPTLTANQKKYYNYAISTLNDTLANDPQIQMIVTLVAIVLGNNQDSIDSFTELVDVDNCPSSFLPLLASNIGYPYDYSLTADQQRVLIKNYTTLRRLRGSALSIQLAARYGSSLPLSFDDPSLYDIQVTPYNQSTITMNGTTYQGPAIYEVNVPANLPSVNNAIMLVNPAGFLPVVSKLFEGTVSLSYSVTDTVQVYQDTSVSIYSNMPSTISGIETSNFDAISTMDSYHVGDFYGQEVVTGTIQALRPAGETIVVGNVTATSDGVHYVTGN